MFGNKLLLTGSLFLLVLSPVGALSAFIKTQSPIQCLWYNDPFQYITQGNLFQPVKLSATRIDDSGLLSTVGCGRVFFRR